jgi:exopolysaccharide biosynthesis polyprenyl glycosylphosphotransferase
MSTQATDHHALDERWDLAAHGVEVRRNRSRRRVLFLLISDLVALTAALPLAIWLTHLIMRDEGQSLASRPWVLAIVPMAIPFLAAYRLYDNDRRRITVSSLGELFATFNALSVYGFLLIILLAGLGVDDGSLPKAEIFTFWLLALVAVPLARSVVRRYAIPRVARPQRTLIVGAGRVGQKVASKIQSRPDFNLEVVGFVDNEPQPMDPELDGLKVLAGEGELVRIVRETKAERIILCFSRTPHEELLEILRLGGAQQLYVSIVPRFFEIMTSNVELDDVAGIPVLDLHPARLSRPALITKRITDLIITCLTLPVLLPVFAVVAAAIKLDSKGPVFFRQPRMGQGGKVFHIYKFRTMVQDAEAKRDELLHLNQVTGPLFKIKSDPRVTRVGGFLRRTSLDELPQLLNVLKGEMSLVGPRPFVTYEAEEIHGWARRRIDLIPGITGAWQVMGRNDMPFDEMVKLDYLYVTNWSLAWDLKLLLQTVPSVLRRRGAY